MSRAPLRLVTRLIRAGRRIPYSYLTLGAGSLAGAALLGASAKSLPAPDPQSEEKAIRWQNYYKNTPIRKRFLAFATLNYNDEPFITGEDFIKLVSSHRFSPEEKAELGTLSNEEYQVILEDSTKISLDDANFLNRSDYLISYSEFLFLLSVLVKPIDQFHRHFRILDRAKSNTLSKDEFLSIETLASGFLVIQENRGSNQLQTGTTSMQVVLFGADQKRELTYEEFSKFLHGIQEQCLRAEFEAYSDGLDFITDDEFMRLVLGRTSISDIKKARYIDRLESRPEQKRNKIKFYQFCQFMNLLNDFPDFEVAIRMYAITRKPLTKKDFQRAVKASTGVEFDQELVDVIFDVFDEDNDNKLGQDEFITVMKDSIKSRNSLSGENMGKGGPGWGGYVNCVRHYMYKGYAR